MRALLTLKIFWKRFFLNIILGSGLLVLAFLFLSFIKVIALPPTNQQVFAQVQEGQEPLESFGDLNPVQEGQEPLEDSSEPVVGIRQRQVITIPAEAGEFGDAVPSFQEGQVPIADAELIPGPQEGQVPIQVPVPVIVEEEPPAVIVERPVEVQRIVEQPAVVQPVIVQPVIEQQPVVIQQPVVEQVSSPPVVITPPQQPAPVVVQPPVQQVVPQPDTQQVITDVDNTNLTSVRNDVSNNNVNNNTNTNNQTVSVGSAGREIVQPAFVQPAVVQPVVTMVERTVPATVVVTKTPIVAGETLPKTGPPLYFWLILGLVPLGLMLGRFAVIKRLAENGNYFWEQKQFIKKGL